jgi:hypothetical protein
MIIGYVFKVLLKADSRGMFEIFDSAYWMEARTIIPESVTSSVVSIAKLKLLTVHILYLLNRGKDDNSWECDQ